MNRGLPVVEATWEDHAFDFGAYDSTTPSVVRVTTVGYLVLDTDQLLQIALSISDGVPHEVQTIDKRMLIGTKVLRKA